MDFIISVYCCQNPQGAALQGCLARGGSGGTIPEHQTGDSYSFLRLITDPLCPYRCSFTLLIFPFPLKKERDGRASTYGPHLPLSGPSQRFLKW